MSKRSRNFRNHIVTALALPLGLAAGVETTSTPVAASPPGSGALLPFFAPLNVIDGLGIEELGDGTTIMKLEGTQAATFNVYRLESPSRLVVDISSSQRGKVVPHVPVDTWAVGRIKLDTVSEAGADMTRVVVELKRDSSYIVVPKGNDLVVTVTPRQVPPEEYFARQKAGKRADQMQAMRDAARRDAASAHKSARDAEDRAANANKVAAEAEGRAQSAKAALDKATGAMSAAEQRRKQAKAAQASAEKALAEAQAAAKKVKRKSKAQRAELERALDQAKAAEQAARANVTAAESAIATLKRDQAALTKTLSSQRAQSDQLSKQIDSKQSELAQLQQRAEKARAAYDALGADTTAKDVAEAEARLARLRTTRSVLAKEVERLRLEAEDAKKRAAKRANAEKKAAAKRAADEAKRQLDERRERLEAAESRMAGAQQELQKAEQQLERRESLGAKELEEAKKAKKTLANAEAALAKVESRVEGERAKLADLERRVAEAQTKLDTTLAKVGDAGRLDRDWKKKRQAAGSTRVKDVRFEDSATESRVVVDVDGPLVYSGSDLAPTMKLLRLEGASIPQQLERSLDTSSFGGPVSMVTSFSEGDDVKLIVASDGHGKPQFEERNGQLVWTFKRKNTGKSKVVSMGGSKVGGFANPPAPMARTSGSRGKWRGERIDIELQDAPIKDVILLFSDIGRVNIIAGQGVSGSVTMRLNSVPWDQALDIILRSLGLGMVQEGNVIRVATRGQLDKERQEAIARANAAVRLKPLQTALIPLSYATPGDMVPKVRAVLTSRGSVTPDGRTNQLIIMDVAESIAAAEALITQLDTQTPQVLIEARIVEARTNWLRQLGIQWGFDYIASAATGNPTGIAFPNAIGVAGGAASGQSDVRGFLLPQATTAPNYAVDLPAPAGSGAGGAVGFSFGSLSGNLNTNLRLSAAEDTGEVRIISAPKIVTLENSQAQIQQGVQIPISQVSAQGVNTRYVNATLGLNVTPHVTNEGSVLLSVSVQKNEADFVNTGARGDPTILTKQAQSQMLITDGDTAVIGGIYTRNQSINYKKVPWFAEIPIIGWFFKNKTEGDTRTEVLIFLTPKILNRASSIGGSRG